MQPPGEVLFFCWAWGEVRAGGRAAFARRKRRKAAGGNRTVDSPPSPGAGAGAAEGGCIVWRLRLRRVALNFRFQRKQPTANSPHAAPDWLRCSRQGGCVLLVDWVDGAWLLAASDNGSAPAHRQAQLRGAGLIPHTDKQEEQSEPDRPCEAQEGSTAVDSMPTEERGESRGGGNPGQQVCLSQMYDVKEGFILPIHHDCGSFVVNGSGYDERKNLRHNRYFHCERSCTHEQSP